MEASYLNRFFEESGSHLILNPDFTIATVGQDYARETYMVPEAVIGKNILDVLAYNQGEYAAVALKEFKASLERVAATRQVDKMVDQRYDIKLPYELGGGWEERWWSPANIPVVEHGQLKYIVHRVQNVTPLHVLSREIKRQGLRNRVMFLLCVALIGLITFAYVNTNNRVTSDERATCKIQAQGLPAGHALSRSMGDIHSLLTLPQTPAEKVAQKAATPPALYAQEQTILANLNNNLATYTRDEAKQPQTRHC